MDVPSLLGQLELEEKASLCLGSDFWHTAPVERLGIPAILLSDGPHGLRTQEEPGEGAGLSDSLPATCFPTAAALASSWDPGLVRRVGAAIGVEARALGVAVVLGPGVNIKRSPLCGRNFEYLSEDPLLAGRLGAALVAGLQSQGVGASVKHYAANNQETDRHRVSAEVDERTLREIELAAFERVVTEARPWTVMCAYNKVNGTYASEHHRLLTQVLRREWGFEGLVVSDWGAVHDRVAALAAGLDLEMPPALGHSDAALVSAVRDGGLDEAVLDTSVTRVLQLVERAERRQPADGLDVDAHHDLARQVARECAVLLKNEHAALPLQPAPGERVAVIGAFAERPRHQGAGSSRVNPTRRDVPLEELRARVPEGVAVAYAPGFSLDDPDRDDELAGEAVDLARGADAVVVFLGLPAGDESEGYDRTHIDLPANQLALLARLAEVHAGPVVVLANGSAARTAPWEHHAGAVLECWLGGQAVGGAVADLLLGDANPCGRLAETIPLRLQDTPSYLTFPGEDGHVRYGEGVFVGYRGYDALDRDVGHPFGHGLSYTEFTYADLQTSVTGHGEDVTVEVSCRVTNVGGRAGKEVAQLYVSPPPGPVARPVRELRGFDKLDLQPGASGTATFRLRARDLSYWSTALDRWALQPGTYELAVGASSRDPRLHAAVEVDAPPVRPPLHAMSTVAEWLEHPDGVAALRALAPDGELPEPLRDPGVVRMLGSFPLRSLPVLGIGPDREAVEALMRQAGVTRD